MGKSRISFFCKILFLPAITPKKMVKSKEHYSPIVPVAKPYFFNILLNTKVKTIAALTQAYYL